MSPTFLQKYVKRLISLSLCLCLCDEYYGCLNQGEKTLFCLIDSINHILKPKGPKMYLVLAAFARWLILPRVVCVIISHSSGRSKQDWCLWTSLNWSRVSPGQSERNCEGNWWITCLWFELQTAPIDGKLFFVVTQSQPRRHDRHNVSSWRSVLCLYL